MLGSKVQARPSRIRAQGFTLIELLFAVTLSVVLAAIALPDLTQFTQSNNVRVAAQSLESGLRFARAEAIRAQTLVTVCGVDLSGSVESLAGQACKGPPYSWGNGWLVFANPGNAVVTGNEASIRFVGNPSSSGASIVPAGSTPAQGVTFTPTGAIVGATTTTITVSPRTDETTPSGIAITVHPSGLIESGKL